MAKKEYLPDPGLWNQLRTSAHQLRTEQTEAERQLWDLLRGRQFHGYKFRRQHAINRFVVDFFCDKASLIIEIDGRANAVDEQFWMVRFTPRKPKSIWSKVNVGRVEQLIAQGRMQPAGLREVEAAKADGRWAQAYDSQSRIEVPEDFQRELDQHPEAQAFFDTLKSANRYAILYRITTAKRPETRAKRIQDIIGMLLRKETFH